MAHAVLMLKALTLRSRTQLPLWKPHHDSRQVDDQPAVVVEQLERSEDNQVPARASTTAYTGVRLRASGLTGLQRHAPCDMRHAKCDQPSTEDGT